MDHLFDLLTELSIDPFKQNELLTHEERAALEQRGSPEVQAAIADGAWTRCAGLFDPGPDPNEDEDPDPADLRDRSPHAFQNDRHHAAR